MQKSPYHPHAWEQENILKAYDLKSGESKKVISNEVGSWGIHDDTIYYTNADDSFRIYTQGIYSGDVDVMAQDKNVDLDVFGNGGIFCMSYTDAGKGSGYFYISYDTFSKTDLMK